MLSDNNIVMGFSIGGFLPCLHIQERGLKQSCSQFTKALGWLPFREWLYSTECGINCQCWWKSTGCTVDITLATGLGEVGSKLISAALILWPGCPRPSSLGQKHCFLVQINCLFHKMQSGLSTSSGMEDLVSSSPFLAILDEIKNISVDLLADKEKKKGVKKKTESSTASWSHAWAVALGGVDSAEKMLKVDICF